MKHLKLFEDFINEFKSVGPLYHFTTLSGLTDMLADDEMISKQYDYISFTRNPALKFYDRHIRIEFDGDAMSNRIHIEPYMYDEDKDPLFKNGFGDIPDEPRMSYSDRRSLYGEEREERAKAPIKGIKKYIIGIDVKRKMKNGRVDDEFMDAVRGLMMKYPDIEFNVSDRFQLPVELKKQAA